MTTNEELKREIEEKISTKQQELDRKIGDINSAIDGEGEVGDKLKAQFNSITEQIEGLRNDLNELDGKVGEHAAAGSKDKSFSAQIKDALENDDRFKSFMNGDLGRVKTDISDVMAKAMTVGTDFTGDVIRPDRRPGVIIPPQQSTHVRDLMTVLPTTQDVVEKPEETSYTGAAAPTAEDTTKPESTATFGVSRYNVETVAHLYRMTRRMFQDTEFIANWIRTRGVQNILDTEDSQLITGDGVSPNLQGFTNAGVSFSAGLNVSNPTKYDLLSRAVTQLRTNFYRPNVILVSPNDYDLMIHDKDANNRYIFGPPVGTGQGQLNVKGIPIVDHESIPSDEFLVMDLSLAAELYDRQQVQVQFSEDDRDNFQRNLVTARIEERVANAVWHPSGIIADTFTNHSV